MTIFYLFRCLFLIGKGWTNKIPKRSAFEQLLAGAVSKWNVCAATCVSMYVKQCGTPTTFDHRSITKTRCTPRSQCVPVLTIALRMFQAHEWTAWVARNYTNARYWLAGSIRASALRWSISQKLAGGLNEHEVTGGYVQGVARVARTSSEVGDTIMWQRT